MPILKQDVRQGMMLAPQGNAWREQILYWLMEQSSEAMLVTSPQGIVLYGNAAASHLSGYGKKSLKDKNIDELLSSGTVTHPKALSVFLSEMKNKRKVIKILSLKNDSAEQKTVEAHILQLNDGHYFLRCHTLKQEAQVLAELRRLSMENRHLKQERQRFVDSQQMTLLAHWEWEVARRLFYASDQLYHLFQLEKPEGPTDYRSFFRRMHPQDLDLVKQALRVTARTGEGFELEMRLLLEHEVQSIVQLKVKSRQDALGRVLSMIGTVQDISDRQSHEVQLRQAAKLAQLAHYDPLSGLPNRLLFMSRLEHAIQTAKREQHRVVVMFIDLDNFKQINDTRGHDVGDKLLIEVATRLQACLRTNDTVARIGGDEFLILLENQTVEYPVIDIAHKVVDACSRPFHIKEQEMSISCSVGISIYPRDGEEGDTLMRNADTAMYQSKASGKNGFHFYTKELTQRAILRIQIEQELRLALEKKQLSLTFQSKHELATGRLAGAEALLRWQHPTLGLIDPAIFLPLAEETGQMVPIGQWMISQVCQILRQYLNQGLNPITISLNLSGSQLHRSPIQEVLHQALQDHQLPANVLELEIAESFIMHTPTAHLKILNELHETGMTLAIDHFGTGYLSLAHLKQLPIKSLKITPSLLQELPQNEDNAAISLAIIALAKNLQLEVIAEGVENEVQQQFLTDAGCQYGQGALYSLPMSPTEFAQWLKPSTEGPSFIR